MSKILLQLAENKFVNNLHHIDKDITILPFQNQLYHAYYAIKPDIIIFIASLCDNTESNQFLEEFQNNQQVKCFVYHDEETINKKLLKSYNNVYHLIEDKNNKKTKENDNYKIIRVPKLINETLFRKTNETKTDNIVCFIDHINVIPDKLLNLLYPFTTLKIKLFNNANINHHQNLGTLTEIDKAKILQKSKYFLPINDYYVNEALACGCEILSFDSIKNMTPKNYSFDIKQIETYSNFIEKLTHEN